MREPIDLLSVVSGIYAMQGAAKGHSAISVVMAIKQLRRAKCFPEAYVDGLQDELLQMLDQPVPSDSLTSVYLAFHGMNDRASFVKVGVANSVMKRMRTLSTGNPMPRISTYAAAFSSRSLAYRIESALHVHLRHCGTSGEWFQVHGLANEAAAMFADSLAEVATEVAGRPVSFIRLDEK